MFRPLSPDPRAVVIYSLLMAFPLSQAIADLPRAKATIVGVYHQDRWGVGRFSEALVSPKLHDSLKKYEGKRIRLECLSIFQRNNPGVEIIQKIGTITPLEEPSLKIELQSRMGDFSEKNNVELAITLTNTGKECSASLESGESSRVG